MQCPNCQATIEAGLVFCPECGARLTPSLNPTPPVARGTTTALQAPTVAAEPYPVQPVYDPAYGAPTVAISTPLAETARWMGICSAVAMAVAGVMMLVGAFIGDRSGDLLAGFGALLGFPALACAPIAVGLGLFALTKVNTQTTAFGRKRATIGAATGMAALAFCCIVGLIIGSRAG
jgi:hypothetical protein